MNVVMGNVDLPRRILSSVERLSGSFDVCWVLRIELEGSLDRGDDTSKSDSRGADALVISFIPGLLLMLCTSEAYKVRVFEVSLGFWCVTNEGIAFVGIAIGKE